MDFYLYEFQANLKNHPLKGQSNIFEILTCQRTLAISPIERIGVQALRKFKGVEAYEYLLRFACGLESQVKGETDVFGQIKSAFKVFLEETPESAIIYQSLFFKLFEDTKEIRANYLHGIGGNSYGALARRLLNPTSEDKVLVVGAGLLSKSVAPYFADSKLTVYNRSLGRLLEITSALSQKGYTNIEYIQDSEQLTHSFQTASLILICTPPGTELDAQVIEGVSQNSKVKIFHFGAQSIDLKNFYASTELTGRVFSLTELFEIEKTQCSIRDLKVAQALEACRHRAILRSMSRSIHLAHGWEDLPAFY